MVNCTGQYGSVGGAGDDTILSSVGSTTKFLPANLTVLLTLIFGLWMWAHHAQREKVRRLRDFPPGPRSSFEFLKLFRHFVFKDNVYQLPSTEFYEKKYGKIIGISTGFFKAVFIGSLSELKEAFSNPAISARPYSAHCYLHKDDKIRGLVAASGDAWKEIRKFTVNVLRDYGMGQKTLGPVISEEAEDLISGLRAKVGRPFSSKHFFNLSAFNIPWQIISGQRFRIDDPVGQNLLHLVETCSSDPVAYVIVSVIPKAVRWPRFLWKVNPYVETHGTFRKFCSTFVNGRISESQSQSQDQNQNQNQNLHHNDLTQEFIQRVQLTTKLDSQFYGQLGYENLEVTIRDLFFAATETSGTTMSWILLYLALHPEMQKKLHREIDLVLGGQKPSLEVKSKMVYMQAVINEALRMSSNAPFWLPHMATEDVRIGKYIVPKGTTVFGNAYALHHSKEIWGDPYVFRPERFLSDDESTLIKHEAFLPFGVGKRVCPGEILAGHELFMFTASIFQEFSITWNPDEPKPEMGAKIGLGLTPMDHTLIITPRETK